jgi:membrane protein implicated in regulation of membrane protease activity
VSLWFWAWVIVAAVAAVVAALTRDLYSAPWAVGALAAAGLEAAGAGPGWQWAAFLLLSSALFIALNRVRYAGRHSRGRTERGVPGRHAPGGRRLPRA